MVVAVTVGVVVCVMVPEGDPERVAVIVPELLAVAVRLAVTLGLRVMESVWVGEPVKEAD